MNKALCQEGVEARALFGEIKHGCLEEEISK